MAASSAQQAYNDILAYIKKQGGLYKNWYVGVTSDARQRLFTDHQVSEKGSCWIFADCVNEEVAREVESALLHLGCDGGGGGGKSPTIYVYAYLKTSQTKP